MNLELRRTISHGSDFYLSVVILNWSSAVRLPHGSGIPPGGDSEFGAPHYDYPHTITLLGTVPDFLPGDYEFGAPPYDYPHYDYPPWNGSGFPPAVTMNLGLRRTITRITITLLGTVRISSRR